MRRGLRQPIRTRCSSSTTSASGSRSNLRRPPDPFAELPGLLALARHENVVVKISGACTLSREPFPYPDIWDPLRRIFDAFGIGRCLWGTDWTRAVNLLTYEQGVEPFRRTDRLSEAERAELMGGALERVYGWAPVRS